jgi:hypothetical protein
MSEKGCCVNVAVTVTGNNMYIYIYMYKTSASQMPVNDHPHPDDSSPPCPRGLSRVSAAPPDRDRRVRAAVQQPSDVRRIPRSQ